MYADDIAIYCSHKSLHFWLVGACSRQFIFVLPFFCVWILKSFSRNRITPFSLSPNRVIFAFSYERVGYAFASTIFFWCWIGITSRFLGVILDANLTWRTHINSIPRRVQLRINVLKAFGDVKWKIYPSLLLNVYKGFIRSVLNWGFQVFSPLSDPVQCILDKVAVCLSACSSCFYAFYFY